MPGSAVILCIEDKAEMIDRMRLMMPGVDGWGVYRHLQTDQAFEDIPVIVVTAKAQDIDKVVGLRIARVADYIVKPFGSQQLLESIRPVLRDSRPEGEP